MKIKDLIFNILIAIISIFTTYLITIKIQNDNSKIRYIDIMSEYEEKPSFLDKKFSILIDGDTIKNFSQRTISLNNFTDIDIENLEIFIELFDNDGKEIHIYDTLAYGEDELTDKIELLKHIKPPIKKNNFKIGYKIKTANRVNDINPFFTIRFITNTKTPPNFKVHFNKKGIKGRKFDWKTLYKTSWYENEYFIMIGIFLLYFLFIYFLIKFGNKNRKKTKIKIKKYVEEKLKDKELNIISKEFERDIIEEIEYLEKLYYYENSSAFSKWLLRKKKPERIEDDFVLF